MKYYILSNDRKTSYICVSATVPDTLEYMLRRIKKIQYANPDSVKTVTINREEFLSHLKKISVFQTSSNSDNSLSSQDKASLFIPVLYDKEETKSIIRLRDDLVNFIDADNLEELSDEDFLDFATQDSNDMLKKLDDFLYEKALDILKNKPLKHKLAVFLVSSRSVSKNVIRKYDKHILQAIAETLDDSRLYESADDFRKDFNEGAFCAEYYYIVFP